MSVAVCTRCQLELPEFPASGTCPSCGSRLAVETPRTGGTVAGTLTLVPPELRGTATAPPANDLTRSQADTDAGPRPKLPTGPIPKLANYHSLELVAHGGMGIVYKGVQHRTDRPVAIKFILASAELHPTIVGRFDTEAKALSRAKHPFIVPILEVGDDDRGRRFFSMEYFGGGSLAQRVKDRGPMPIREAADLTAGIAEAVAAAHAVGVLHRDLKPGNVLVADDGTPRVTDFGLAKLAEAEGSFTGTGDLLGTPGYMSPEQARGDNSLADERSDTYGIGAILYHLLTGHAPFEGESRQSTVQLVLTAELRPARSRRPEIPADLDAVCSKCLAKDPTQRYQTAQELADDVRRFLNGLPTVARPPAIYQRLRRTIRKAGWRVAAVGSVLLALVAAATIPSFFRPSEEERKEARWKAIAGDLEGGKSVELIGETGPPNWSEWHVGSVELGESIQRDKTFGFQTFTTSVLVLGRDPMTDTYRLSADVRHIKKTGTDDAAAVGAFVGMGPVPTGIEATATQWIGFEYSEFWREQEVLKPNLKKNHGLDGAHFLTFDWPAPGTSRNDLGVFPFEPTDQMPNDWRTIEICVSPQGIDVYLGTPLDRQTGQRKQPLKLARSKAAVDLVQRLDVHNKSNQQTHPGLAIPPVPWNPRLAFGIYARNSAVSFKNVIQTPNATTPSQP